MNTINIAVFYNKNQWSRLLQDCLLPLLGKISQSFAVKKYLVVPAFERGQHIRLILWADKNSSFITNYSIHCIKSWLKKNPSDMSILGNEELYLWMNYGNNSVHLNSFSQHKYSYSALNNLAACQMLSRQVSYHIIDGQDVELADLLSSALLLGIMTINLIPTIKLVNSLNNTITFIKNETEMDETEIYLIKRDFEENKDILLEYYYNIHDYTDILQRDWMNFLLDNNFLLKNCESKESIIVDLLRSINSCFGLSASLEVYELIFISELLSIVVKRQ